MDSADHELSADEASAFRRRCRSFLATHATCDPTTGAADPRGDRALAIGRRFQRALYQAGLAGLTLDRRYGGQGLSESHERIWREEAASFPPVTAELSISLGNCLPTLVQFGTEEQKRRHVPEILAGREVFCQLFSEPGAGSDVAAVQMRAVRRDGAWMLNGQKVWTTLAHVCEYGILLARTDPGVPKHAGLSMFILDMRSPGIEVRPIHQIDGGLHFNEVFLSDVVVPDEHVIPPVGGGWAVARGMLTNQRLARGTGQASGVLHPRFDRLAATARANGMLDEAIPPGPPASPAAAVDSTAAPAATVTVPAGTVAARARARSLRHELTGLYVSEVCQSLVAMRTRDLHRAGRAPGASGSVAKLLGALVAARHADLTHRIVGAASQAWPADHDRRGGDGADGNDSGGRWAREGLTALSLGIAGGTNEIQRNIIAERMLGLPREPSTP
jgi:alkylation response protein AidB-like acyl-CoA dehydrogenase